MTVYWTLFLPISKSFGRFVSTFAPPIVNTMVNIPDSSSLSELSVKLKPHVTVAIFVPGSLSAVMPAEQLSFGGSESDTNKQTNEQNQKRQCKK